MNRKKLFLFTLVVTMCLVLIGGASKTNAASKSLTSVQVANYFNNQVGKKYPSGHCLKFIADSFASLGAVRSSTCCAYRYGSSHLISSDISNIPMGADVYFGNCGGGPCSCGAKYYGHIGVYVGNGYFVHATGGKVQKTSLLGSNWKNKYRGWGWHENVSIIRENISTVNSQTVSPSQETAVISNVSIHNIDANSITFSWSTTGKRSLVEVTSGDHSWKSGFYTSSNVTCTFDRSSIPECLETVQIRIYSYINSGGPEIGGLGETCHLMTYGTIGYVEFPKQPDIQTWIESVPDHMISQGKISGWAIANSGINSVKISVNENLYDATLFERLDVEKAYPAYDYVKGWSLSLTPYEIKDGNNSYAIEVNLTNGNSYIIKAGTFQAEKIDCLFDPIYFRAKYYDIPEIARLTTDSELEKYYYHNLNKSYDPSMIFSPTYYASSANQDIKEKGWGGIKLYEHLVQCGIKSGKEYRPTSEFVNLQYLHSKYSDLAKLTPEQLFQWVATWGIKLDQRLLSNTNSAKAFQKFYQCREYASLNKDLIYAFSEPVVVSDYNKTNADKYWSHLWKCGLTEKRNISKEFYTEIYVKNAKLNRNMNAYQIFSHYISIGYASGIKTK